MEDATFFEQAVVYLAAAVVAVPLAKRFGLGSVLGYLLAGVAIGPFALGLVAEGGQDVLHFAEFGVVLMLFLIGLELEPNRVWEMRGPIVGLGGLQVGVTTVVALAIGVLAGLDWRTGLAIGMTLALSSTAIVLQSLKEKGLLGTSGGQSAFSVLLFQDMAVIPILAVGKVRCLKRSIQTAGVRWSTLPIASTTPGTSTTSTTPILRRSSQRARCSR